MCKMYMFLHILYFYIGQNNSSLVNQWKFDPDETEIQTFKHAASSPSSCVCGWQNSMRTMHFTEENIGEILRLLAGILHAGNIEFMTAGGAQVSSKSGQRVSPHFASSVWFYCRFRHLPSSGRRKVCVVNFSLSWASIAARTALTFWAASFDP